MHDAAGALDAARHAADAGAVRLISRGRRSAAGISLRVRAEVLEKTDVLAAVEGTSNLLLLHTDLMGTIGTMSIGGVCGFDRCTR